MKKLLIALCMMIACSSFLLENRKKTTLWLIGDSTMSIKETRAYPETGWGMPFTFFWDSSVVVENRAKNGRSTRTFMQEGLWAPVEAGMQEGDYLFIQFGHNDEVKTKASYTTEEDYAKLLTQYITAAKNKKATPVLLTPVGRRKFDSAGAVKSTHEIYSGIVRRVAKEQGVVLIDLEKSSMQLYQQLGNEASKLLFLHLKAGEHPNYPQGKEDDTHFNELGARKVASLVFEEIRKQLPPLANRMMVPPVKK